MSSLWDERLLTQEDIILVVRAFYARVREDELLAPIFATRIQGGEWPAHEDHIASFWRSIFLKDKRFTGNPIANIWPLAA